MMAERKLVADGSIEGYVCNSCGWAWPTPSLYGGSPERGRLIAFNAHECSNFVLPHAEELKRFPGWEEQAAKKSREALAERQRSQQAEEANASKLGTFTHDSVNSPSPGSTND
jgi:hypothetical protein